MDDPLFSVGLQRIALDPLPPPMSLGMLRLRGVPLSAAARSLAQLLVRHGGGA